MNPRLSPAFVVPVILIALAGCQKREPPCADVTETILVKPSPAQAESRDGEAAGAQAAALTEANRDFTYQGQPIHPFALKELLPWISDDFPGPLSVDIAGTFESNRYFGDVTVEEGVVTAANDGESFSYRRLGTLSNGWHVLSTSENGGGSGVFMDLLLVRVRADREYGDSTRYRLVLERRGAIMLGDRYAGGVEVRGDSLFVMANESRTAAERPEHKVYVFAGVQ